MDFSGDPYNPEGLYLPAPNLPSFADPGTFTSGAQSWADVLKFGVSRYIDARLAPSLPANNQPQPAAVRPTGTLALNTPEGGPNWLILGALAAGALALYFALK